MNPAPIDSGGVRSGHLTDSLQASAWFWQAVREAVRTLHPGYFAPVMATGVVSVGLRGRVPALSTALMYVSAGTYLILLALNGWRVATARDDLLRDLADPARGFGFLTFVAGTDVLGARLLLAHHLATAGALLVVGRADRLGRRGRRDARPPGPCAAPPARIAGRPHWPCGPRRPGDRRPATAAP
jgi:hypothetical protein